MQSFETIEVPHEGLKARWAEPRMLRCMVMTRANVPLVVNGSALDALWRFAGSPPTDESAERAVEALGTFSLCACGRHASDGHRYQSPSDKGGDPLCGVRQTSVDVLHRWARRARLLVAFAAHLRLCRKGGNGRKWDARIPCMGQEWTTEETIIGIQGPGEGGGVACADGEDVDGTPRSAARYYLEDLGQWVALQAAVQAWLSATRPLTVLTTEPPPARKHPTDEVSRKARYDSAASQMNLDAGLSGNSDAICVAGLELANILVDVVEGRRCFQCGKPVHLLKRGSAKRPCCANKACIRERDRLQRRESQARLKDRVRAASEPLASDA